ncbi:phosphatase PAP2 family protein [Patescibacteria group bacterium]|nr:phosphatase PAP2 family protein [Patescibacteria group bacterium]
MIVQILALAMLAIVSLYLFFLVNSSDGPIRQSRYTRYIPFVPAFIVPYLGLFPYVAFSMLVLLFFTPVAARLYVSLIFSSLVATLIWYFMPSKIDDRPEFAPNGLLTRTIAWMYRVDPGGNSTPSSHAYTAILCSYYLTFAFPLHNVLIWSCGATIVGSTLFVKQHHISDLIAGSFLAAVSIAFSYLILGGLA